MSDYSSAAADVRLQIATTRVGRPDPVTAGEREGIERIRNLVELGSRFDHEYNGNLDFTSEQVDLVEELGKLIPGKMEAVKGDKGIDLKRWSELAVSVLDSLKNELSWESFSSEQVGFIELEFEPFLVELLNVDPEYEEE